MESMEAFMRPLLEEGPAAASPALFPNTVYNAAAGQVGIILGTLGPTSTVTAGHAAGAAALGYCADILGRGEADAMVCVAADTLTPTVIRGYHDIGAVGGGLRLTEGAVALIVEREDAARLRGATPRATVLGHGTASDAAGIGRWDLEGRGVERAIRAALDEAGVGTDEVAVVWPHACGLRSADRAEEAALQRVFAGRCSIRRPKRSVGDALGAGGPLNIALALTAPPPGEQVALFVSSSLGGTHVATVMALTPHPDPSCER
jgi:3-oxoacyl-[acyl-carrier-protein] synthase II